jgi:hypothetical protein
MSDQKIDASFLPVPYPDSYWVIPGQLLAGEYPGDRWNEENAHRKIGALLQSGIRVFIDLTGVNELIPYSPILKEEADWMSISTEYYRHSILDFSIPESAGMLAILNRIDAALSEGKPVYVHCWGGIGRTGTVVGCYLVRHGLTGRQALERIRQLRSSIPYARPSPESDEQVAFVRNWGEEGLGIGD